MLRKIVTGTSVIRTLSWLPLRGFTTEEIPNLSEFFAYTSGRWICNERKRLQERFVKFDVLGLQKAAAKAVGANSVVSMSKLPEGSFNKAFLLKLDNGKEVIARIPNPNAGPAGLVTASEVATMEFARSMLQIPVPRVLDWSTRPQAGCFNDVGSHFIIMEKARGIELSQVWEDLDLDNKMHILDAIVAIETKFSHVRLPGNGSLYFVDELPRIPDIGNRAPLPLTDSPFVIGPSVELAFWEGDRSNMPINRGPWEHAVDYISAIARCEKAWINRYAVPLPLNSPARAPGVAEHPHEHLRSLDQYLQLAPYLLPADPALTASYLWHTDFHGRNIFVAPALDSSGKNVYQIVDVIDWQHVCAGPLYLQARVPEIMQQIGPAERSSSMAKPTLPGDFSSLLGEEKEAARKEYLCQLYYWYWMQITQRKNSRQFSALTDPGGLLRVNPTRLVGHTWGHMWGNELLPFRAALVDAVANWDIVTGADGTAPVCPLHFSADEILQLETDLEEWNNGRASLFRLMDGLGVDSRGLVLSDSYETSRALNEELRKQFVDEGPIEEQDDRLAAWPFQDGVEHL